MDFKFAESLAEIRPTTVTETISHGKHPQVVYVCSPLYLRVCDRAERVTGRASIVHDLISSYGVLNALKIICPKPATREELCSFHSEDYIDHIIAISKPEKESTGNDEADDSDCFEDVSEESSGFGLGYDCPVIPSLYEYVSMIGGATLSAAQALIDGSADIAVNWGGGWHHAKKDEASGFCYVNDIVLGILRLRTKFSRVLYIDLDVHHGDGVEEAFNYTGLVMCVSFHKFENGFFPGTGRVCDVGFGKGKYHSVNVPLLDGIRDDQYYRLFAKILSAVKDKFRVDAVVCQCGADGLVGDPMDSFNLTPKGLGNCVDHLLQWNLPTLLLGGGGYNFANTARCWAYLTSLVARSVISTDIPDNKYFELYGPDFDLEITPGNRPNKNHDDYVHKVASTVLSNLQILS